MGANDWLLRRQACLAAIQIISTVRTPDEATAEEKESALQEYNRQLSEIDDHIEALTGKRPDTVINLQAASLTAIAPISGG